MDMISTAVTAASDKDAQFGRRRKAHRDHLAHCEEKDQVSLALRLARPLERTVCNYLVCLGLGDALDLAKELLGCVRHRLEGSIPSLDELLDVLLAAAMALPSGTRSPGSAQTLGEARDGR
jgi:hypothetical protein